MGNKGNALDGLQYHAREVEKIAEAIQEATDRLYRPDGQPLYGDAEMAERRAGIAEAYRPALEEHKTEIARYMALGRQQETTPHDLSVALSDQELARASAMAQFVREDLAEMEIDQLRPYLERVIESGDKIERWLVCRYAGKAIEDAQRNGEPPLGPRVRALRDAAQRLADVLDPKRGETIRDAQAAQTEGVAALRTINRALDELDGRAARSLADLPGVF